MPRNLRGLFKAFMFLGRGGGDGLWIGDSLGVGGL